MSKVIYTILPGMRRNTWFYEWYINSRFLVILIIFLSKHFGKVVASNIIFATKIFSNQDIKMDKEAIKQTRKLSQLFAYTSIQMHEAVARKAGLSGTDHKYLGFLIEKGQMTAGELSHVTGLTTGAVTGLIDRFEKKKLVKRQFAKDDRRKVIIVPNTENIMALLEPLYATFRNKSEKLFASFSKKEIKIIETYFLKAVEIMNETTHNLNNNK